ncbi:MAG: leucyl aminopeptidase [Cytophagales bacterium]|nr:leucyl aminopeptidase [Cytophagales bacterium]
MEQKLIINAQDVQTKTTIFLFDTVNQFKNLGEETQNYLQSKLDKKEHFIVFDNWNVLSIYVFIDTTEKTRHSGYLSVQEIKKQQIDDVSIVDYSQGEQGILPFMEGFLLSLYSFDKYKSKANDSSLDIYLTTQKEQAIQEIENTVEAVCIARDLVNEPSNTLTAEQLSHEIEALSISHKFNAEILTLSQIQSLKMGGLLSVNQGSSLPPTFNILEHKPENPQNSQPIILVGKGVVYDTGGLSLKPTPQSMDIMKCDMGGAAAVVGAFCAIAKNNLPLHIIGLIPATDNHISNTSYAPGDVITMFDQTTVEVMNTDAEGRLILADALSFAKKYNPELVIDLATLTGSALHAIGHEGIVYMGTTNKETKQALEESGNNTHERLVEFPLWEEYSKQLKSPIADLKNIGGPSAGAITAGKFLEHFTSYDWLHLDIAGPAFLGGADSYRSQGGTGVGVRLLYDFLKTKAENN